MVGDRNKIHAHKDPKSNVDLDTINAHAKGHNTITALVDGKMASGKPDGLIETTCDDKGAFAN